MLANLEIKCKNLMTFISSNLYIHSSFSHETTMFSNISIPSFLSTYLDESIKRLIAEKETLTIDEVNDNQVYLYIDPFKICYLTWPILAEDKNTYTITLGPLITEHLTNEEIRYIGYKMKLSSDNCFILESFYSIVPFYEKVDIIRISSMFLDYLAVEPKLPQIIREDHSILLPKEAKAIENKFESFDFVEKNYILEAKFLEAIEKGDTQYIHNIIDQPNATIALPPRFPSDPLRELKNLSITLNSISLRAALRGGLNQSIAHNLSHNFAILIEQQTTHDAIVNLNNRIMMTYTDSVRKYALKNHSETIIDSVNYIRTHLTSKVTLTGIADYLHLSREHLSRLFKEEMNMTITDYIHKLKVEESLSLLTSEIYSVSDISYIFSYSSPTHYSKAFTKHMGLSPKKWQKEHKKKSNEI